MGGSSKAALGVSVVPVFTAAALPAFLDNFTLFSPTLFVSSVTTIRFLFDFTPGAAGSGFEIILQTSSDGNVWFDTTIDAVGVLTQIVPGTFSVVDTHIRRFRAYAGKHLFDLAITLNKSTPYLRMGVSEYVNAAAPPGVITVTGMLS